MKGIIRNLSIAASYITIIGISSIWSGYASRKTLYDRYFIQMEGLSIICQDCEFLSSFYTQVLDLASVKNDKGTTVALRFPRNGKLLFLDPSPSNKALKDLKLCPHSARKHDQVVIKVRNGIENLREEIAQKLVAFNGLNFKSPKDQKPRITEISSRNTGNEFSVFDPSGNELIFFKPKRRSASRY